jgi:tetratricopeptide (TPR) repeat protein
MTPSTYTPGAVSASAYRITQPLVALRYFGAFVLPTHLSADTDHTAIPTIFDLGAAAGFLFLIAILAIAVWCSKERDLRPIAFGLYWFVLALVPTSIFPLAEVENDHRMFFPFVGLSLAVCWAAALWFYSRRVPRAVVAVGCALVLAAAAWGTVQRNRVWKSEETLWRDVAAKSPRNGRGLMNYGLTLMAKGDYQKALDFFTRALVYDPNYMVLEVNLGIDNGALGNDAEAERHFARALQLSPAEAVPNYFYAVWLKGKGRSLEAVQRLNVAVTNNPSYLDAQYLLMQTYADLRDSTDLRKTAMNTLAVSPSDQTAQSWLARAGSLPATSPTHSPEDWVTVSLALYQQGKYEESINAAREALKLRPGYAIPWNNIAANYNQLGKWDDSIHAAQEAIRLDPNFQLAKNNLAWSLAQKQKHASR